MKYFDCDCLMGMPKVPLPDVEPGLHDLLAEMRRLDIDRALVRHRICVDSNHEIGNAVLMEEVAEHDNLVPVWYVTADGLAGEWDPAAMVSRMLELGVRASWTTLGDRQTVYTLEPRYAGKLLTALEDHRIPLLLLYSQIPPSTLKSVLESFPSLPVVLLEVPRLGRNPVLYPLMEQHQNLILGMSALYSVHRGLEDLCNRFGHERLLFGSSYPGCEGGASIAALTYAELPGDIKDAIAHGNLERVLSEVRV